MANRTVKEAISIKGTNPQYLVEKIIRTRIYDSRYWKEDCFGLTAELVVDKAIELKSIGGAYGGNVKPTPFLCLVLKLLQIQPDKDIIVEFIRNKDYKYIRALGAFYMRLTGSSAEIYKYLEPLYSDYRKMKRINKNAAYELVHMDEFIDELLHGERVCDVALPRIQKRQVLEEANELEARVSPLDINLDDVDTSSSESGTESEEEKDDEEEDEEPKAKPKKKDGKDKNAGKKQPESEGSKKPRYKFVDYDNPDPEDEMPKYRRSPDRDDRRSKHGTSSKSRRRSRSDDSEDRRRHHSSSHRRHKDRHRRSRSRSRRRSTSESSRSRSRSRDRRDRHRRRSRS